VGKQPTAALPTAPSPPIVRVFASQPAPAVRMRFAAKARISSGSPRRALRHGGPGISSPLGDPGHLRLIKLSLASAVVGQGLPSAVIEARKAAELSAAGNRVGLGGCGQALPALTPRYQGGFQTSALL